MAVALAMVINGLPATRTAGVMSGPSFVLLKPHMWRGNQLPISNSIDIGPTLMDGMWTVILYRPGCPECQARIADRIAAGDGRLALVAIPPFDDQSVLAHERVTCGKIIDQRKWLVGVPAELKLEEGVVVDVSLPH